MKSKRYCPDCGSFKIHRVKRSLLQKYVFKHSPKYKCAHCFTVTSRRCLEKNALAHQTGLFNIAQDNKSNQGKMPVSSEDKFKNCA